MGKCICCGKSVKDGADRTCWSCLVEGKEPFASNSIVTLSYGGVDYVVDKRMAAIEMDFKKKQRESQR